MALGFNTAMEPPALAPADAGKRVAGEFGRSFASERPAHVNQVGQFGGQALSEVRRPQGKANMTKDQEPSAEATARKLAKARVFRGSAAIGASAVIAILIATGIARPWPNQEMAYLAAAAFGVWGLIDLIRGLFGGS